MTVGRHEYICSVIAIEVHFAICSYFICTVFSRHFKVKTGELRRNAILGQMSLGSIAERNRAEIGRNNRTRIGSSKDVLKVYKSPGSELCITNAKR